MTTEFLDLPGLLSAPVIAVDGPSASGCSVSGFFAPGRAWSSTARDMDSVVMPDAALKVFLTASVKQRAGLLALFFSIR